MNVKTRERHHLDILSWREGWCRWRSWGNFTSSNYTVTFFLPSRTNGLLLLSVSDATSCLPNLIIPLLPSALPLQLCFGRVSRCPFKNVHLPWSSAARQVCTTLFQPMKFKQNSSGGGEASGQAMIILRKRTLEATFALISSRSPLLLHWAQKQCQEEKLSCTMSTRATHYWW